MTTTRAARTAHLKALAGGRKAPATVRTKVVAGHLISQIQCDASMDTMVAGNLIGAGETFTRSVLSDGSSQFDLDVMI